ncbi:PaaI family thioesterase [Amycolatopsis acidicola]|uniref:Acyl-coenzyme A thioesterase THEM4 n=1 Tax=Amycolatopsis acidicola TaxID=2596893 RepID=A0A5N0UPY8_9PSEU|nr:hotdog domain-containing protein [Amycolatopsis acidicola]KAA9153191.1 PaaI family thioesterase [Amycolatopsis acidicola]
MDQISATPGVAGQPGGPEFGRMIEALRTVQAAITGAAPPPEVSAEVGAILETVAGALEPYLVGEDEQLSGHRDDLPGRGQPLLPPLWLDERDETHLRGRVTFDRFHLGGNGAAHGGAITVLFDEMLGRLANAGRNRARTKYLQVEYHRITPLDTELRVEAKIARVEGRKRFLTCALYDGEHLTADAEGLFVELLPGQP